MGGNRRETERWCTRREERRGEDRKNEARSEDDKALRLTLKHWSLSC
jgi:hypothetical protein